MGLLTSGYSMKRDGPTGRARGTSRVFTGWHHIWKAAALWWVSTHQAIIRVWSSNRLDGGKDAVSANRLVVTKPLPLSGNFENIAKSPPINLRLFSLIVTSFATCRFSKLHRSYCLTSLYQLCFYWIRAGVSSFCLLTLCGLVHAWSTRARLQYEAWWWEQCTWHAPLLDGVDIILNFFAGSKTQKFRERG